MSAVLFLVSVYDIRPALPMHNPIQNLCFLARLKHAFPKTFIFFTQNSKITHERKNRLQAAGGCATLKVFPENGRLSL